MVKKTSIAVFGNGFVGGSMTTVMSERGFDVYAYDKGGKYVDSAKTVRPHNPWRKNHDPKLIGSAGPYRPKSQEELDRDSLWPTSEKEFIQGCEKVENFSGIYFVCLPTPMNMTDGSADLSIVEGVLDELANVPGEKERIAVIKSTVTPGSTEKWNQKYKGTKLKVVFSPEFLTEANALDDMRNQDRIILGGPKKQVNRVRDIFRMAFPNVPIHKTSSTNSELVKYTANCYLAVKVAYANEIYALCDKLSETMDVDYDRIIELATLDKRLGTSHWKVPGPMPADDGSGKLLLSFGGSCLPKDVNNLISLAKSVDVKTEICSSAWSQCLRLRPERDWMKLEGRAVSKK